MEEQDINLIITEYPDNVGQQAMVMLRSDTEIERWGETERERERETERDH